MNVSLLTHTYDPLRVLWTAARCCYSDQPAAAIWAASGDDTTDCDDIRMLKTVRGCIARNHNTVMRHANFTFAIDRISRACGNQLTRHGVGWSFDQQSLRYVKLDTEPDWVIPPHLDGRAEAIMRASARRSWLDYRALIEGGVKAEDARAVLPLCTPTNLVATANLAALLHFHRVRFEGTTGKPQDEIKELAGRMIRLVVCAEPWLGEFFAVAS